MSTVQLELSTSTAVHGWSAAPPCWLPRPRDAKAAIGTRHFSTPVSQPDLGGRGGGGCQPTLSFPISQFQLHPVRSSSLKKKYIHDGTNSRACLVDPRASLDHGIPIPLSPGPPVRTKLIGLCEPLFFVSFFRLGLLLRWGARSPRGVCIDLPCLPCLGRLNLTSRPFSIPTEAALDLGRFLQACVRRRFGLKQIRLFDLCPALTCTARVASTSSADAPSHQGF